MTVDESNGRWGPAFGLTVEQAAALEAKDTPALPFPGAYPGPVVDDSFTWGAMLSDAYKADPNHALYQVRTWEPQGAEYGFNWDALDHPRVRRGMAVGAWVLVRRTPKPATAVEVLVKLIRSFPETTTSDEETAQ